MSYSKFSSKVTETKNRIADVAPFSGLCGVCLDGCPGNCEVFRSSLRGREVIYPVPFGEVTAGAIKDYPVDYSHFNITGSCAGAYGVEADPDKAIFPAVDTSLEVGNKRKVKLKFPVFSGALGSTDIAKNNWEHIAAGCAISGLIVICGENVCGMDPDAEIKNGRVIRSPDMERRVKQFREYYDGYGDIIVQYNVEDGRLGVPEYVHEKLGVEWIEIKWGQGAKDIGGEVKLRSIERAKQLKERGYLVIPDPDEEYVRKAFKEGELKEFERHSRLGMVDGDSFQREVERLRKIGFKNISLKTGAYRARDLAMAIKYGTDAEIDLITIDGAGGGTGMSPWRMMNEWGIPTVYLQSLAFKFADKLAKKGKKVPALAIAGGLSLEDHIFKALALGAPYFKLVCLGRALMIPAMVGKNIQKWISENKKLPRDISVYGNTPEEIFITYEELRSRFGEKEIKKLPLGAIAVYTYVSRLKVGLQQLMAGARKFKLNFISRDDIVSLTEEAAKVSGIPYVMEADMEEAEKILNS